MARTKPFPERPAIDEVVLTDLVAGDPADLCPGTDLEGVALADVVADRINLARAGVHESHLAGLRAGELDLTGATLVDTVVDGVDVPVVRAVRSTWRGVSLRTARLGSAELYESRWRGVDVVGCKLGYVNLRGATLDDVRFTDCIVDELDLVQATATRVAFAGTRVRRLDVQGATLRHVDLRGAGLEELSGLDALAGTAISPEQLADLAPALAAHLGITVLG
ncbi:pentapeptide repeat-containing protein [Xylanimonas protaetiae]|uniref:Pentapeptide repeat-containing protein n=1 Tax=Xylanimonas protaetiae TaxID=2509457 RepID=A0A4P6F1S2_9MICO|nr:pentapeptide repeat-containing protein [Xylanimonas protaetiae]QAY69085.1 pentapeptide repeat-containing protein [Xylanimonas protaetiae]